MLAVIASAYHGPPELTFARAFTSWTFAPWSLAGILVPVGLYAAGVWRMRRLGSEWSAGRSIWFCGLAPAFGVIATMSSVGVYQPVLFYMRSVQTILLLLIVPLFFALGRPLSLVIAVLPRIGPKLEAAVASRIARLLTFPAITAFVVVVTPFLIYFTPWYAAGFRSALVAQATNLALMVPGYVFFWTLLRVDPVPKAYPYIVTLWITGAEVIGDAILGLAVIADTSLIAGHYYHVLARPWGPGLPTAQVLGGGVLWVVGDIIGLPFLAAQLIQMIREDESDAKVIDAELDAIDAAALAAAAPDGAGTEMSVCGGGDAPTAATAGPSAQRPWWEGEGQFSDRFRSVDGAD